MSMMAPSMSHFRFGGRTWRPGQRAQFTRFLDQLPGGYNPQRWLTRHPKQAAVFKKRRGQTPPITPPRDPRGQPDPQGPQQPQQPPWASDPILVQAQAAYQKNLADAQAGALAQRQKLLVEYGSPELAESILGKGSSYAQAAGQNPYSVLGRLRSGYEQGTDQLNEQLNKANLFYSSTRGKELDLAANLYQQEQYDAAGQVQGMLDEIAQNLLGGSQEAEQMLLEAQQDAYQRWLEETLLMGGLPAPRPRR